MESTKFDDLVVGALKSLAPQRVIHRRAVSSSQEELIFRFWGVGMGAG